MDGLSIVEVDEVAFTFSRCPIVEALIGQRTSSKLLELELEVPLLGGGDCGR